MTTDILIKIRITDSRIGYTISQNEEMSERSILQLVGVLEAIKQEKLSAISTIKKHG